MNDGLWKRFPLWLEISGLPGEMVARFGAKTWLIFRSLVETDCSANITPGWFITDMETLSRQTGLLPESIQTGLENLVSSHTINMRDESSACLQVRIVEPIRTPRTEEEVRAQIESRYGMGGRFVFRYGQDSTGLSKVEKVMYLYQMVFGIRFTPSIVEDLEWMAAEYDLALIYDIFSEAHRRNRASLAWVRNQLKKRAEIPGEYQTLD